MELFDQQEADFSCEKREIKIIFDFEKSKSFKLHMSVSPATMWRRDFLWSRCINMKKRVWETPTNPTGQL